MKEECQVGIKRGREWREEKMKGNRKSKKKYWKTDIESERKEVRMGRGKEAQNAEGKIKLEEPMEEGGVQNEKKRV